MAREVEHTSGMPLPILSMLLFAIGGGILVALSFQVIIYWPLPVAVAPYYEDSLMPTGFAWGFIVGAFVGWLIGWLTDERHFIDVSYGDSPR